VRFISWVTARFGWKIIAHHWMQYIYSIKVVKFVTFQSSQGQFIRPILVPYKPSLSWLFKKLMKAKVVWPKCL